MKNLQLRSSFPPKNKIKLPEETKEYIHVPDRRRMSYREIPNAALNHNRREAHSVTAKMKRSLSANFFKEQDIFDTGNQKRNTIKILSIANIPDRSFKDTSINFDITNSKRGKITFVGNRNQDLAFDYNTN